MNQDEIERLQTQVQSLQSGLNITLAILLMTLSEGRDAKTLLLRAIEHFRAATQGQPDNHALNSMMAGVLLPLSSVALKQHPQDQETLSLYRQLRDMVRH